MYHIKHDHRSLTSAQALYHALQGELATKSLEQISISDLVKVAQVGRSTFYRNFDEILDILKWQADTSFAQVLEGYLNNRPDDEDQLGFIRYVFTFWEKHYQILELLNQVHRTDVIYDAFMKASPIILDYLEDKYQELKIPDSERPYFLNIRIGIFLATMNTWITNGRKESPDQIAEILKIDLKNRAKLNILF